MTDKLRVVLVDDQPLVRDLLKMRLHLDGRFDVVGEAYSGGEALMHAKVHQPDVIILDVGMPGISGLTVLPALAEECPEAKIVVYTGNSDEELERDAFERGAHFVADKLMSVGDLILSIAVLCGRDPFADGLELDLKDTPAPTEP
jgi:two-component system, NarL family, nitrate/nitrite response regulator NarL